MSARPTSPDVACARCGHANDEHHADGVCLALKPNTARPCGCDAFLTAEQPDVYGIATYDDVLCTVPADVLRAALAIAHVQIAESDDDEWATYGYPDVDRDAASDALAATLAALDGRA